MKSDNKYIDMITEEIDAADEIIKSDGSINFNSFTIKDELNPDIFGEDNKMKPEIREKLLNLYRNIINDSYIINEKNTDDVVVVGSLVSYHYSSYSDIDFHIIVDMESFGEDSELIKEFLNDEKRLWNLDHNIQIAGYDVEIYYQDVDEKNVSNGCYSVLNDEWVKFPDKEIYELDRKEIERKALFYMDKIDKLAEKDELSDDVIKLWDKIKNSRGDGLDKDGEFSVDNIVFKILRRSGHLDKLHELKMQLIDDSMLESNKVEINPIIEKLIRKSTRKLLSGETKAEPAEWDGIIINDALGKGMFENTDKKLWIPYYIIIRDEMKNMNIKILEQKQEINNMKKINFGDFNNRLYESVKDYCKSKGSNTVSKAEIVALIENEMATIDKCEVDECGDAGSTTECAKPEMKTLNAKKDNISEDSQKSIGDLALITVSASGDDRDECRKVIGEKIKEYAKKEGIDKVNIVGAKCKEMRANYDGSGPKYTVTMVLKVDGIYGDPVVLEDEREDCDADKVDECIKRALDECGDMD